MGLLPKGGNVAAEVGFGLVIGGGPFAGEIFLAEKATLWGRLLGVVPEEEPVGKPPIAVTNPPLPMGGDLISPPMLTSCFGALLGLRPKSTLPLALALLISAIHEGCCGGGTTVFGFGESGLFKALSNQLAFVGLHLLESIVLEGLDGGVLSLCEFLSFEVISSSLALFLEF